jgi:hypothetical protein
VAVLRAKVKETDITVQLTVEELHRLLQLQDLSRLSLAPASAGRGEPTRRNAKTLSLASSVPIDLAAAIRRVWPAGIDLVDQPELTSGNVRRFLIQKIIEGQRTISTAEVAIRFFGRQLHPNAPRDSKDLRRVWYCIRQAKREIEQAVGARWEDATESALRPGASRSWRLVPTGPELTSQVAPGLAEAQ